VVVCCAEAEEGEGAGVSNYIVESFDRFGGVWGVGVLQLLLTGALVGGNDM
jgi:hypothetical protein